MTHKQEPDGKGAGKPELLRQAGAGFAPRPPFGGRGRQPAGEDRVSPYSEENALRLEKEGKFAEAAHEFWGSASAELGRTVPPKEKNLPKAIGLFEKAAFNHLRARDGRAVMAFMEIMRIDRGMAREAVGRLTKFCGEEAERVKGENPGDAAYLQRVSEHITGLAEGKADR
ncbi:hypothetical protein H0O01_00835 [Candidatus Micrarchaeota archaeon]|nr:hypothetical protein [Candidatus Micrarchaeota archaeon]